ncbi:MAG: DUF1592 domain-containing protein [Verrucomicrobiales bacterium]
MVSGKTLLLRAVMVSSLLGTSSHLRATDEKKPEKEEVYTREIQPILKKYCNDCHDAETTKGDLNLENFSDYEKVLAAPEPWQNVLERVQSFEMPPSGKKELPFDVHQKLMDWLRKLPKQTPVDCSKIASDRTANFYKGYVMSRRLNRAEYTLTMRDLLEAAAPDFRQLLPADGGGGEGFDTSGDALFTSSIHIEKYLAAAEMALEKTLPDSSENLTEEQKAARMKLLLGEENPEPEKAAEAARKVIERLATLAFRRPVESSEVEKYFALFERAQKRGDGYLPSLKLAMKGILISPNFLFLDEIEPEERGIQPLAPFPLASRLSYFLWSTMPDEELFNLARSGKLAEPDVLRQQARRMLADPKANALGERFAMQWLDLEKLGAEVKPDPAKFKEWDAELEQGMKGEVALFFNHILKNERPLTELIDADYTFVNERLAKHYGLTAEVKGTELQKVSFTDKNRGGVTSMGAVHASTSFPLRTSPVLRGRWVLENLLGDKVKPPPPDVPALEEHSDDTKNLTLREQLQAHRANPDCSSCHDKMDPLGFGMENFDVMGRWRELDRGLPIDSKGTLPSGETFTGPAGLKSLLMDRKEKVMRLLVRKMTGYAYGRDLNRFDDCVVDSTMKALKEDNYRSSVLVEQIVLSFPFRHRFYPNAGEIENEEKKDTNL